MAILNTARDVAFRVLEAVELDDAYANLVMSKILNESRLDSRDAGMAQELAFGVLRSKSFYEHVIEQGARRSISEIDIKTSLVLLLGVHQLLGMRVPAHAAISETVNLAKKHLKTNASGFVNGVLRRVSEKDRASWMEGFLKGKDATTALADKYSHPLWITRVLMQALDLDGRSDELERLLELDNEAPEVNLVALPGFCDANELIGPNVKAGFASPIGLELSEGNPAHIPEVAEGRARVQDQGSQLVALAMVAAQPVTPGEEWLDLCAGPGGKAALLAALAIRDDANLTCNEMAPHRAKLVEQALAPINRNVFVRTGDGRDLGDDAPEAFDRILIDAPCTGLGALRRRPEARWRKRSDDLSSLVPLQKELIESGWQGLKPGGVLVYSTCSPHTSESVAIVDWAVKKFKPELLDVQKILLSINPSLEFKLERRTAQLWPQAHGTDAMFVAIFRKPIG